MSKRPIIAISSCILGQAVRYDGRLKHFPELCQQLQQHFDFLAVCPETEIGLGVPRPAVQLSGDPQSPRMTGRDNPSIDITDKMLDYCNSRTGQLNTISGYVFKSKSPSCGIKNIPVFQGEKMITQNHQGLFACSVSRRYPDLPITDETLLQTQQQRDNFIQQVLDYYAGQTI